MMRSADALPEFVAQRAQFALAVVMRLLGDCVLSTPALDALKQHAPHLRLSVVMTQRVAPLFFGHPAIDELIVVPERPTTAQKWRLIRTWRRRAFDLGINFHGNRTSGAYTLGSRGVRVGMADFAFPRLFYTHRIPPPSAVETQPAPSPVTAKGAVHKVRYRFALVEALGVREAPGPLTVPIQPAAAERIDSWLTVRGLANGPFAVVQPTAAHPPKGWPAERFAVTCRHLWRTHRLPIVVTTGPNAEGRFFDGLARALSVMDGDSGQEKWLWHLPAAPLPELAAMLARATLYLGTDTGPTHIAAAVGCPSVAVYGPTEPGTWHPWGVRCRTVSVPKPCRPCKFTSECPLGEGHFPSCMGGISSDLVIAACDDLLAELGRTGRA